MLNYNPLQNLPSSDELPDSDDTPVDNELQNLIPALLRSILNWLWGDRQTRLLNIFSTILGKTIYSVSVGDRA